MDSVRRPMLLTLVGVAATFLGASWAAFVLARLAGWREGWLGAGAWQIPAAEAFYPMYIPGHFAFVLSGVLAYAIWRRRRWIQPLMVLLWFAFGLTTLFYTPASAVQSLASAILGALLTWLYLTSSSRAQAYLQA